MTADDRDPLDSPVPDGADHGDSEAAEGERCWNCGATLPEGAMFCGECGSAVGARASRQAPGGADSESEDAEAQPVADPNESGLPPHGDALIETPAGDAEAPPERVSEEDSPEPSADQDEAGTPPHGDALLDPDAASAWSATGPDAEADAGEYDVAETDVVPTTRDGEPAEADSADPDSADPDSADADSADPDSASPLAPLTAEERFAAERLLDPDSEADKFVLQFSTGESATVYGSGLVGRNPVAEPGEYVDHLVVIRDPGRSVSKTHLEFGQDHGSFWVLDRFSGNGSALREPEGPAKRCEPGRRYFVARGTRIEIGDQFFVVS
jgi:zinc-ribbon domain